MREVFTVLILFVLSSSISVAQGLVMRRIADEDSGNVYSTYEYNASDHFLVTKLSLYTNGKFAYYLTTFPQNVFSTGVWRVVDDTLVLVNSIEPDDLPVKLYYSKDTSKMIDGFRVGIVKNLEGQEMPDGLVSINNDSVNCAPSFGMCNYSYHSIDSIKIVFENGICSKWLRVDDQKGMIMPIVQTDFLVSAYMLFAVRRFKIECDGLRLIE